MALFKAGGSFVGSGVVETAGFIPPMIVDVILLFLVDSCGQFRS